MAALTAARPRWYGFLPGQLSTRPHVPFATFSLQPPSASPPRFSNEVLVRGDSPLTRQASPFPSRLADAVGRIEFTFVWDHGSAFGCSPPRLMTTQLPLAALPLLVPGGVGLSPLEFMHVCSHPETPRKFHPPRIPRRTNLHARRQPGCSTHIHGSGGGPIKCGFPGDQNPSSENLRATGTRPRISPQPQPPWPRALHAPRSLLPAEFHPHRFASTRNNRAECFGMSFNVNTPVNSPSFSPVQRSVITEGPERGTLSVRG
jgi:hypothetical protein